MAISANIIGSWGNCFGLGAHASFKGNREAVQLLLDMVGTSARQPPLGLQT